MKFSLFKLALIVALLVGGCADSPDRSRIKKESRDEKRKQAAVWVTAQADDKKLQCLDLPNSLKNIHKIFALTEARVHTYDLRASDTYQNLVDGVFSKLSLETEKSFVIASTPEISYESILPWKSQTNAKGQAVGTTQGGGFLQNALGFAVAQQEKCNKVTLTYGLNTTSPTQVEYAIADFKPRHLELRGNNEIIIFRAFAEALEVEVFSPEGPCVHSTATKSTVLAGLNGPNRRVSRAQWNIHDGSFQEKPVLVSRHFAESLKAIYDGQFKTLNDQLKDKNNTSEVALPVSTYQNIAQKLVQDGLANSDGCLKTPATNPSQPAPTPTP